MNLCCYEESSQRANASVDRPLKPANSRHGRSDTAALPAAMAVLGQVNDNGVAGVPDGDGGGDVDVMICRKDLFRQIDEQYSQFSEQPVANTVAPRKCLPILDTIIR